MSFPNDLLGLVACDGCDRHVRGGEGSCPFCGKLLRGTAAGASSASGAGGATVARAVILAGVLAACNTTPTTPTMMPAYGGPPPLPEPVDAGVTLVVDAASPAPTASYDHSIPAPAYGGPPPFLQVAPPPTATSDAVAPDAGARRRHPR